jgi:predicted aldo/keto reductase-like oxidoreductase
MDQVEANLAYADTSGIESLSEEDVDTVRRAANAYREMNPVPCTKCRYCMPCPHGVDIPRNFELYNGLQVFEGNQAFLNRILYNNFVDEAARASSCQQCKECEPKCPQSIKIAEWMPKVHEALSQSEK